MSAPLHKMPPSDPSGGDGGQPELRPLPDDFPAGSRDLTLIERCLKHAWTLPEGMQTELPKRLAGIASGEPKPDGGHWSDRSQLIASRILKSLFDSNLAAARLELDTWRAQQPGDLSSHSVAAVCEAIGRMARDAFGETEAARRFERQLIDYVLQSAKLQRGTEIEPGDVDQLVREMDETVPDEEEP